MDDRPPSILPESLDQLAPIDEAVFEFSGFGDAAFEFLDRLAAAPHVRTYQRLKPELQIEIQQPFKAYRDDQVVGWVLRNRLDLETERNVFSRFLKNDFGAGGCHSHLWMSFYRPGRSRLKDIQLAHSLGPLGLTIGVYVSKSMGPVYTMAKKALREDVSRSLILSVLDSHPSLSVASRQGTRRGDVLPEGSFDGLWIRTRIDRDEVVALRSGLSVRAADTIRTLWPVYHTLLGGY